jgi:hypothetical protein
VLKPQSQTWVGLIEAGHRCRQGVLNVLNATYTSYTCATRRKPLCGSTLPSRVFCCRSSTICTSGCPQQWDVTELCFRLCRARLLSCFCLAVLSLLLSTSPCNPNKDLSAFTAPYEGIYTL